MSHDDLKDALESLEAEISEQEDPKEVARLLWALTRVRLALSSMIDDLHARLSHLMDSREQDFGEGIGLVKRTREQKTTWDHDGMFQAVVAEHRTVDPLTGELTIDGFELARDIQELVAFSYWRKNKLREKKIDFSEFSSDVYGKPRVRFLSKEGY